MRVASFVLLVLVANWNCGNGSKILSVFPFSSKSHVILGEALCKELARRGHEVTMITTIPVKTIPNFRNILVEDKMAKLFKTKENGSPNIFKLLKEAPTGHGYIQQMGLLVTESVLRDNQFQRLLKAKNETFDLVIIQAFYTEALFALGSLYNAPTIAFSNCGASSIVNGLVGNPNPYAISPVFQLGFGDHMTFIERLQNVFVSAYEDFYRYYFYLPKQDALLRSYYNNAPPLEKFIANISLVLLNSHVMLSFPKAYNPKMVEIGGFHVASPKKLPNDIQEFLDSAKDGAIYFSMGSSIQSKDWPNDKLNVFLKVFSKLKQKILWKWESDTLSGISKNVKVGKWLPQPDILAHRNLRAFITHGGMSSTTESLIRGVPVIGIPILGDQYINMAIAVKHGYAVTLDFDNITRKSLSWALDEIINNDVYALNAKRRSAIINDQLPGPLDKAVFWVEHIIRHGGGSHLQTAAMDLDWYQYMLLDIVAFVFAVLFITFTTIYWSLKKLFGCLFNKKSNNTKKIKIK